MNVDEHEEVESIPPALGTLLRKLEFLSMIEKGKKPCMHDWTFVDADSWSGVFYRFFKGENKYNMLLHIQNIIEETVRGFNDYPMHKKIIINTLFRAKRGIENLRYTYDNYPDIIASLIVVLKNIDIQEKKYGIFLDKKSEPVFIPKREVEMKYDLKPIIDSESERPTLKVIPTLPSSKIGYYVRSQASSPENTSDDIYINSLRDDPTDKDTLLVYPDR